GALGVLAAAAGKPPAGEEQLTLAPSGAAPKAAVVGPQNRSIDHSPAVVIASVTSGESLCRFRRRFSLDVAADERAVYFIGDSAFRNQFDALCLVLGAGISGHDVSWRGVPWDLWTCAGTLGKVPLFLAYSPTPTFSEDVGLMMHGALAASHPPSVIYFGSGLWLQWPTDGERTLRSGRSSTRGRTTRSTWRACSARTGACPGGWSSPRRTRSARSPSTGSGPSSRRPRGRTRRRRRSRAPGAWRGSCRASPAPRPRRTRTGCGAAGRPPASPGASRPPSRQGARRRGWRWCARSS
ncbi:unnamed protein product, partial [Prorocentrum cordatum]